MEGINQSKDNYIEEIVLAIYNKSKLNFRYSGKLLRKQAMHISPAYRDFILKVIKNGKLKIRQVNRGGNLLPGDEEKEVQVSRRAKNSICADLYDEDCLPHEIGHCCDFWFGRASTLTRIVCLDGDKSLYDIFNEEFEEKCQELYQLVMSEYKNIIDSTVKDGAYKIIMDNIGAYRILKDIPYDSRHKTTTPTRRRMQKMLYDNGFVETYYQFATKHCFTMLNTKYSPILDALSSKYDFSDLFLNHHDKYYYTGNKYNAVQEFFANLFMAKVTSKHAHFDYLIKYLPRSFNAFERLFVIFYDHIMNNKRFTDLKIKKEKPDGLC